MSSIIDPRNQEEEEQAKLDLILNPKNNYHGQEIDQQM